MKININNRDKLKVAIDVVEKRCRARCITADDILSAIDNIERQLTDRLYKKDWRGIRFHIDCNGQSFPSSYNGVPGSTQVLAERGASDWFIIGIKRDACDSMKVYPMNMDSKKDEFFEFIQDHKNWNT